MTARPWPVLVATIAGITIVECTALICHVDGTILGLVIAALAGIGGFSLSKAITK